MKEFLQLNRSKLVFAFKFTLAFCLTLVLIIFGIGYLKGHLPELTLFLTVILSAGIGFPIFIIVIGTLRGAWDLHKRRKAFGTYPFSELSNYGFTEKLKNDISRWQFSEPILTGKIDNFEIIAEVDTQHEPDIIKFQALTEVEAIGKNEVRRLTRKFSTDDIHLDFHGVSKRISVKNHRMNNVTELTNELARFIQILNQENFKPKK